MSNKQNNATRERLDTQYTDTNKQYSDFINNLDVKGSRDRDSALRGQIQARYTDNNNFMPTGMTPGANGWFDINSMPGGGGGGGGGADFSNARTGYQNFADTGGVNRKDFDPALDSYKGFMANGGVDATALRQRATAQIPAFYTAYKNAAARRSNVQGGYSPGFDSQMAELGRQQGREGFNASRQVEGDIADKVQQGKMFGTTGYGGLMSNITGMEQQGKLAGLGGLKDIGTTEGSWAEARAGRNQQMQQFLLNQYQGGGMESARGLQNLYSSQGGESEQSMRAWLAAMGGRSSNDLGNLGIRSNIKGKDWMGTLAKVMQMGGTGANIYDRFRPDTNEAFTGLRGGNPNAGYGYGGSLPNPSGFNGEDPWVGDPYYGSGSNA